MDSIRVEVVREEVLFVEAFEIRVDDAVFGYAVDEKAAAIIADAIINHHFGVSPKGGLEESIKIALEEERVYVQLLGDPTDEECAQEESDE